MRVEQANGAARVQPTRAGYINAIQVYPFSDGALYQVYAAPGEITDIALEAGRAARRLRTGRRRRHRALDHRRYRERGPAPPSASTSWSSRRGRTSSPTSSSTPTGAPIISSCARPRRPTWRRSPGPIRRTSSSRCAGRTPPPTRPRPSRPASTSTRSTSATGSKATIRPGGRCAPSTTGGRCSSSSRAASARARCRRSGSSARKATASSSTIASRAIT